MHEIDVSCAEGLSHLVQGLLRWRIVEHMVVRVRSIGLGRMIGRSASHRCIVR